MYTQLNMMCCSEGPHWKPTPYNAIYLFTYYLFILFYFIYLFIFWIKEKLNLKKLNLEAKIEPKNGNFGLKHL